MAGALPTLGQVRSYTLGINVNCLYGVGECWIYVRDGMERRQDIAYVSDTPNIRERAGQFQLRDGAFIDPAQVFDYIRELRAGITVRGVEATIDGRLEEEAGQLRLRVGGTERCLPLVPLQTKVQWDEPRCGPQQSTLREKQAHQTLRALWVGEPFPLRITGPLVKTATGAVQMEVRLFGAPETSAAVR